MTRLDYNSGYNEILYCACCGSSDIIKTELDNGTIVECWCNDCYMLYTINLYDNSL